MLHALLCLSPAIVLAVPLLARRYPGERTLRALRRAAPVQWPHARSLATHAGRRVEALIARGGELLASYLAVRPPPVAIAAS